MFSMESLFWLAIGIDTVYSRANCQSHWYNNIVANYTLITSHRVVIFIFRLFFDSKICIFDCDETISSRRQDSHEQSDQTVDSHSISELVMWHWIFNMFILMSECQNEMCFAIFGMPKGFFYMHGGIRV